jgi:hypothetical protein
MLLQDLCVMGPLELQYLFFSIACYTDNVYSLKHASREDSDRFPRARYDDFSGKIDILGHGALRHHAHLSNDQLVVVFI